VSAVDAVLVGVTITRPCLGVLTGFRDTMPSG